MNNKLRQKGWKDMSQRLDAGMPGNRRRGLLFWWLFGAAAVTVVVAGLVLKNRSQPKDPVEPLATTQSPIAYAPQTEESENAEQNFDLQKSSKAQSIPAEAEKTSPTALSTIESQESAADPSPATANVIHESMDIDSERKTSAPPLFTAPELNPSEPRILSSALSLPRLGLSALSMPGTSELLLVGAKIKSAQPADVASTKKPGSKGYFIDLSAGLRTAQPNSYVAQTGVGWRAPVSDRWEVLMTTGIGIDGMHRPAQVALKELQSNSQFQLDGSTENTSNEFSEISEIPEAQLHLKNNYFAYLGAHLSYSLHQRWSLNMGVEVAYRFHSVHDDPVQLNPGIIAGPTGGMSEVTYNSRQIEERFLIFNRWDIRPIGGLSYALRPGIQLEVSYRHGLIPLLAHPTKNTPSGSARFLQLGVRYQVGG